MSILNHPLLCIPAREFAILQALRYVVIFIFRVEQCFPGPCKRNAFPLWKMFAKSLFKRLFSHIFTEIMKLVMLYSIFFLVTGNALTSY